MKEYIDKELFLSSMGLAGDETKYGNRDAEHQSRSYSTYMAYEILDSVDDATAADVVERKRGEWAIDKEDLEWGNALKRRYCTNCKKRPHFDKEERVFVLTDFCPNCGADMRVSHREE